MTKKTAFITGITGQDGSYLAELLLEKGYRVAGLVRRVALEDKEHRLSRIMHILKDIELVSGSIESYPSLYKAISKVKPDEVYHLAAQSFVSYSFEDEFSTLQNNLAGTHFVLSAVQDIVPHARLYFAGTSEMFGKPEEVPQHETTRFNPRSSYGISKVAGFHLMKNYRDTFKLFACTGILYNHESPRRSFEFVTRKITSHVAMIKLGLCDRLELGNLEARRDWGHARDYVRGMWLMLQNDAPDDFVLCTGSAHTVRDFCNKAFAAAGLDYEHYVSLDTSVYRADEGDVLVGDFTRARQILGWQPTISFDDLIAEMVASDLQYYSKKV
jgi:GDPmannose 4,6-dehydratase